jgi:hypothetical protein
VSSLKSLNDPNSNSIVSPIFAKATIPLSAKKGQAEASPRAFSGSIRHSPVSSRSLPKTSRHPF